MTQQIPDPVVVDSILRPGSALDPFLNTPIQPVSLLVSLVLGLALSIVLRWHFVHFASTLSNRHQFANLFSFLLLTTVLVITVVKSSLALSLGLVGALSIVRFRTPIKEPEELVYLFMAIAIGLGLGANQWVSTVLAAVFVLTAVAVLNRNRRASTTKSLYLSLDWKTEGSSKGRIAGLNKLLIESGVRSDLRRFDVRAGSGEATYFVEFDHQSEVTDLLDRLEAAYPDAGVTFIDQGQMPTA